jgi:Flp pilus assembly protein TadG
MSFAAASSAIAERRGRRPLKRKEASMRPIGNKGAVAAGARANVARRFLARFIGNAAVSVRSCAAYRADKCGASAVEFALVSPLFVLLIFGVICYATIESMYIGTQELVSEAARASVAGLSDTERSSIVSTFVTNNIGSYAFLDPRKISVTSATINTSPSTYQVNITYDMSGSFVYQFSNILPLPSPTIKRTAVVLNGGA